MPAYLVGSVPFGFLLGRWKGVDIRQHGSGNIGATNVWRILGKPWGITTFTLDFLKAPTSAIIAGWLDHVLSGPRLSNSSLESILPIIPLLGAVVGHNYPCWLKFKGGKGIATSAGGLLWLMPETFLVVLLIWVMVFAFSRYVSLASLSAAVALPVVAWIFHGNQTLWIGICCFLSVMALWRHRENICRLKDGTEHRWTGSKQETNFSEIDSRLRGNNRS